MKTVCLFGLVGIVGFGGCGTDAELPPVLTGQEMTVTWGPVSVPAGTERTQCITADLGNDAPVQIQAIHNSLAMTSHHLIIYRDDLATTESLTPTDCTPFAGTLSPTQGASPLMITQKRDDLLTLPSGVAYSFSAHQHVRLELHYLNSSDDEQQAFASSTLMVGAPENIHDEASFLFIGTPDIQLQPGARSRVEAFFTPPAGLADVSFYAITGHTHALGTEMQVGVAPAADTSPAMVYAPPSFTWSEPPTIRQDPAFTIPDGSGFKFHCDYNNTTDHVVEFGESATDEMCFFWAYYYPSRGARMCVHSTIAGGPDGIDVCCPAEAGDQLSEFVCSKLGG